MPFKSPFTHDVGYIVARHAPSKYEQAQARPSSHTGNGDAVYGALARQLVRFRDARWGVVYVPPTSCAVTRWKPGHEARCRAPARLPVLTLPVTASTPNCTFTEHETRVSATRADVGPTAPRCLVTRGRPPTPKDSEASALSWSLGSAPVWRYLLRMTNTECNVEERGGKAFNRKHT